MVNLERIQANWLYSFTICKREAWLIAHGIEGYQENIYLELGRLIHEKSYSKEVKREISLSGLKIDLFLKENKGIILGEIKSSSKKIDEAKIQMMYYIMRLREYGLDVEGEILVPKEKKRIKIRMNEEEEVYVKTLILELEQLIDEPLPPKPVRKSICPKCSYFEFCWG
ncbi:MULTISPECIES: CRISPR-associated protein Cas4 [unclassified Thermosipho (in: thermotogales)]|uniref:CRISPR-associated protein Cas4 n=1 Tax=unclassified Thermosipho (in: thermotogales) TaxID=2676525 RepID=UPI000985B286|nr:MULTISPECIES: CRISPR-associated protein Cas4 [unclassified Thermosipho (in: thermotogales)]MBT1248352.1 hypothetical protein [Thermosipho sp. 1244]OOC47483.1 hypothetical protein XO09_00575 [Thermosipho sp. 1223]